MVREPPISYVSGTVNQHVQNHAPALRFAVQIFFFCLTYCDLINEFVPMQTSLKFSVKFWRDIAVVNHGPTILFIYFKTIGGGLPCNTPKCQSFDRPTSTCPCKAYIVQAYLQILHTWLHVSCSRSTCSCSCGLSFSSTSSGQVTRLCVMQPLVSVIWPLTLWGGWVDVGGF